MEANRERIGANLSDEPRAVRAAFIVRRPRRNRSVRAARSWRTLLTRLRWAVTVAVALSAGFLLLALLSYSPNDPGWSLAADAPVTNVTGPFGAYIGDFVLHLFGGASYLVVIGGALQVLHQLYSRPRPMQILVRWAGLLVFVLAACGSLDRFWTDYPAWYPVAGGGILGDVLCRLLELYVHGLGVTLALEGLLASGLAGTLGSSCLQGLEALGHWVTSTPQEAPDDFEAEEDRAGQLSVQGEHSMPAHHSTVSRHSLEQ